MLTRKSIALPAQLSDRGHGLIENRHDRVIDCRVTLADGFGEQDAAKEMAADRPGARKKLIGSDKNNERSGDLGMNHRTIRHDGHANSINARRSIEKILAGSRRSLFQRSRNSAACTSSRYAVKRTSPECLVCT